MSFVDRYDIHDVPSYTNDKLLLHEEKHTKWRIKSEKYRCTSKVVFLFMWYIAHERHGIVNVVDMEDQTYSNFESVFVS